MGYNKEKKVMQPTLITAGLYLIYLVSVVCPILHEAFHMQTQEG